MASAEIFERWNAPARKSIEQALGRRMLARFTGAPRTLSESPFGVHEQRSDFRGLPLDEIAGRKLEGTTVSEVDLSFANLEDMWIEGCEFRSVSLAAARMRGFGDHGNSFESCNFTQTNCVGAAIGYKGSGFRACRFDRTDFSRAIFIRAQFDDCEFADANLDGVDFNGSSFRRCSFSGLLNGVWFRGGYGVPANVKDFGVPRPNEMLGVDFSQADMVGCHFSGGCDLSTVKLPTDGRLMLFDRWSHRLNAALAVVRSATYEDPNGEAEMYLSAFVPDAKDQPQYLLSRRDVESTLGPDRVNEFIDLLGHVV